MAETTQYAFSLREIAELLIRKHGIREGRWTAQIEFGLGAGHFGPSQNEARPTAFVQVNKILLSRAIEDTPSHLVIDAEKLAAGAAPAAPKSKKRKP